MIYTLIAFSIVVGVVAMTLDMSRGEVDKPHYSGHLTSDGTLKPYDQMTTAEHDEAGAVWAEMARGDE